jgi:uncharacterized protein YcbX
MFIYPVKSLAGIAVDEWPVVATGLLYDRQWMLIDEQQQFLSQRQLPQMALIQTALNEECLILSAPSMPSLSLPLLPELGHSLKVQIWQDYCVAHSVSRQADEWFSQYLGRECQLVYQTTDCQRSVDANYALATDQVSWADGFPFLVISEASLAALNAAMNLRLSMQRFRPNLVIAHCHSYAEDYWRQIQIGAIEFRLPKACSRCAVPAIDPETGRIDKEPLATLNRLRKWQNKVYFGQNALHNQPGILRVGDRVIVKEIGDPQPALS